MSGIGPLRVNNATPENGNDPEKIALSKYYDIDEICNIEIPHKNKPLSLFFVNACSPSKSFDDLQHLLSCTEIFFDIIAVSEIRITKNVSLLNKMNLNNYCFEFTPTETCASGTLLYIANHLSCKCCNVPNICKKNELESTFIEIVNPKSIFLLRDLNVNLLNYNEHNQTNEFLDSLAANSFIPFTTLILQPTRITSLL